jgi:hypothetical protein
MLAMLAILAMDACPRPVCDPYAVCVDRSRRAGIPARPFGGSAEISEACGGDGAAASDEE